MTEREVADLLGAEGTGPVWGLASADLNATVLSWPAGHEVADHVNEELDVLLVVLRGDCVVAVAGRPHDLREGAALLIDKGSSRAIRAGSKGVRYLSVHRRRGPLQVSPAA